MSARNGKAKGGRPKKPDEQFGSLNQTINLVNPVSDHFRKWVFANSLAWERLAHDELIRMNPEAAQSLEPFTGFLGYYATNFQDTEAYQKWHAFRGFVDELAENFMVREDSAKGQTLALCGAGPSLAENLDKLHGVDQIWGANSALPYLIGQGFPVTHGITVDQTAEMLNEWVTKPDVEYLLSTTVHPNLTRYLIDHGRRVRFFHNFVGMGGPAMKSENQEMAYEDWLYTVLFPGAIRAGSGLNTVNRALDVALHLGFSTIYVLGADCALRCKRPAPKDADVGSKEHRQWLKDDVVMHADGGSALASGATHVTLSGVVDGRHWETKPDMVVSAIWLVKQAQKSGGRVVLVGDTLPNALMDKDDAFLARVACLEDSSGNRQSVMGEDRPAVAALT